MEDELIEKVSIIEAILGDQLFFAGDHVTIADISLGVTFPYFKMLDPTFSNDKLEAWYERVKKVVPALAELNGEAIKSISK